MSITQHIHTQSTDVRKPLGLKTGIKLKGSYILKALKLGTLVSWDSTETTKLLPRHYVHLLVGYRATQAISAADRAEAGWEVEIIQMAASWVGSLL